MWGLVVKNYSITCSNFLMQYVKGVIKSEVEIILHPLQNCLRTFSSAYKYGVLNSPKL